jgi:putative glutamine amidotransferase
MVMNDLPLRIGVSQNFLHADPERALFKGKTLQYIEERMALSIFRAGGVPLPLPDLKDELGARAVIAQVHGLVLAGGADVSPLSYGEEPLDPRWAGDPVRDAYEQRLVHEAIRQRLPVLGLCRGIQLINVALGGSLWQDIETQRPDSLVHRDWHRYDELGHAIDVDPESWIGRVHGRAGEARTLEVNSIHHQGLRRLADGLKETAWAPDGVIEAVEWIDEARWVVGVQWHPEWLEPEHVASGGPSEGRAAGSILFDAFLEACRERQTRP